MKGITIKIFILIFLSAFMASCSNETQETKLTTEITNTWVVEENLITNDNTKMTNYNEWDIVAIMKTTNWAINILLETEKTPITTTNFIGLAKQGYYDGVIFHRIIKDFMIQWWDPDGTGMGGVSIYGESFNDEIDDSLKNNKYTISMANSGPNTNGSQFFINTNNNNFLDGKHAVFGRVVEWFDNVDKLEKTKTDNGDRPVKEVKMISVEIKEYKGGTLKDYAFDLDARLSKIEEDKIEKEKYKIEKEKSKKNKSLENGDTVYAHYTLTLEDGTKKDSSLDRGEPFVFTLWAKMVIKGWDEGLLGRKIGDKFNLEVSPEDGYGLVEIVIPKTELQSFIDSGVKLEKGEVLPTDRWNIEILDANEDSITIKNTNELAWKKLFFDIEVIDIK